MPHRQPHSTEYMPHHTQYVSLVAAPVLDVLRDQRLTIPLALLNISEKDAGYRYAQDKWSIREVVGHISDAERIFQFRALVFARGDAPSLPRYAPDEYVANSGFDGRTMQSLIDEFLAVRESTLHLFETLEPHAWDRSGTISGGVVSVRAMAYIAAGHAQRHLNVLYERYGIAETASDIVSVA
jgi:hypothetical protein